MAVEIITVDIYQKQVTELQARVASFAQGDGPALCKAIENQSQLIVSWLGYLHNYHLTNSADSLLSAVSSSIRETAACLSLGLIRPALFSLRSEIDLLLAWLFFKDHPIEWRLVNQTGDGFWLKKDILDYLSAHFSGSRQRLALLKQIRKRKEEEPYRLLSAHIHGQSEAVLPALVDLKDSVGSSMEVNEAASVCFEVSEYLSDVLFSVYALEWDALPADVKSDVVSRFVSDNQKKEFWSY